MTSRIKPFQHTQDKISERITEELKEMAVKDPLPKRGTNGTQQQQQQQIPEQPAKE